MNTTLKSIKPQMDQLYNELLLLDNQILVK